MAPVGDSLAWVPLASSPLVGAAAATTCPKDDQVGTPRPLDGNTDGTSERDIGAIEVPEPTFGFVIAIGASAMALARRRTI